MLATGTGATFSDGIRSKTDAVSVFPPPPHARVRRMGCGDVRLLAGRGSTVLRIEPGMRR
jgi:hypothetical protein